jgi:4-aminobutyrate aminotransferase/(S)-3-amino-2-methylpropionate transaminase
VTRLPIVLARGEGSHVWDVDDNRYVDLAAGFGAALLGHGHTAIKRALAAQSERLIQGLGDVYASDVKVQLLGALAALHHGDGQTLLGQSGGDAVTAALKTATLTTGKSAFIAFDGAYHGLGYGPLPACGYRASFREPFKTQLNANVRFAPYPGVRSASADASLSFVRALLREGGVAAILVEPIIGRGGCVVPPSGFIAQLGELAHAHDALLIADEIWTGLGRAGSLVRSREDGASADIVCFGKGLGGGLPISACVGTRAAMDGWRRGGEVVHTSTHAGAPLGCATALATLATLHSERLVERSAELGARALIELGRRLAHVAKDVRGAGLMIGIELEDAATAQRVQREALARGYLVIGGGIDGATLTLTPALTIAEDELFAFGDVVAEILAP